MSTSTAPAPGFLGHGLRLRRTVAPPPPLVPPTLPRGASGPLARPGARRLRRPVLLVGMRGAGKTSVGRRAAELLGVRFVDLDEEVLELARHAGRPAAASAGELLARDGERAFRELEAAGLRRLLEPQLSLVLAAGGGAVEREDARSWMRRSATSVWLRATPAVLAQRLRKDPTFRPALLGDDPVRELGELLERRAPLYASVADHELDTDTLDVEAAALALVALVRPAE